MHRMSLFLFLVIIFPRAHGAFQEGMLGPMVVGMGGVSVAVSGSCWGTATNPSLLSEQRIMNLSISFSPHRFGLTELATGGLLLVHPTPWGTFGAVISHTGFNLYREMVVGIGGGWRIGSGIHAGLSIRYFHLAIEGHGKDQTIGVQAGLLVNLNPKLNIGFSAGNLNSPVIGERRERIPQVYRTGISYKPATNVEVALDLVKDILHPLEFRAGFQYRLLNMLVLRCGTGVEPSQFGGGIGLELSSLGFDYAFTHHSVLGITHQLALNVDV